MTHRSEQPPALASPRAKGIPARAQRWRHMFAGDRCWLIPLLVLFLAKGIVLIAVVAPFTGHDEVDHFYYIARLAHGDGLGVVGKVDLPPAAAPYQAYVADYPTNAEVIQPPLYHLLLVPVYWAIPGGDIAKLEVMRFVSLGLGAVVVWLAYAVARLGFPGEFWIRAGTPVFVAFQPQFSFEAGIVNHDILVILLSSLLIYFLVKWLSTGYTRERQLWLAAICAAGLWTKTSFGLVLPVVALCAWFARRDQGQRWWRAIPDVAVVWGGALLLALPWFIRSYHLYGDPTGARRLHTLSDYGAQASTYRAMITSAVFWRGRLEDFWGNYGWRLVPFDIGTYQVIELVWVAAGAGLIMLLIRVIWRKAHGRPGVISHLQRQVLAIITLWVLLLIYGVLYIGTIQFTQSRFAFPAMIGFGVLTVVGLGQWAPKRGRPVLLPLFIIGLTLLNVVVAIRFLIPFYFGAGGPTGLTQ
ncbi:MAG TPA: hypothetical protein VFL82_11710 [Thermomicrobiales bacterium]|nr:hypothetical protein [Thermomicrobiales bacterium]